MSVPKATGALMDAAAAAEAEGFFAPTDAQMQDILRLKDIAKRQANLEAEEKAIKMRLISQMNDIGAVALVKNGKNLVHIVAKTKEEFYEDAMAQEYPEIVATYIEAKAAYDEHKPEFTFRVEATPANTFPVARGI